MPTFRERLANFINPPSLERKEFPMVMYQGVTAYNQSKYTYQKLSQEGYQQNAIVYRCINEIANGASAVKFNIFDGDTQIENHPLEILLQRPNPQMAGTEYFQSLYSYLLLDGNSYALRSDVNGRPSELHILRPDRMTITPSKTQIPKNYQYKIGGQVVAQYDVDQETGASEVKHLKLWNPLDDYYGLSPISAAAVDIDQHNLAARHNVNLLNNGARPSGAIVFKPKDDAGMPVQLSEAQRQQLHTDLNARFSGPDNSGRAMLLEGDFDWKEMGLTPKDMDFLELKNMSARDIALCFGVPSQLVGVPDAQTYANVQEARLALYEDTIVPLMMRMQSDLNEWLAPSYGDNIQIKYDIDSIPAMAERRRRIYDNVINAVREGIISRNEARSRLGLDDITGGDDVYIAANLFPLGAPITEDANDEDAKDIYASKREVEKDIFTTEAEAEERAEEIGCTGIHAHETENGTVYMPCASHADYTRLTGGELVTPKAEEDIDTKPTEEMAQNAKRGLELRKEFGRGGTAIGVARANQLVRRDNLSPSTVRRMHSFFSRHEVDKEAEGFRRGEDGYPSAGKIANLLWGGDAGQSWARRKVDELNKERDKNLSVDALIDGVFEEKQTKVSEKIKKAIANKVKDHNDEHGDKKGKRVTQRMLEAVFRRGVGAFNTNPSSVRPTVTSSDQWALARINAFLYAVRNNKFRSGKFDLDLLPEGHPLKSKKKK